MLLYVSLLQILRRKEPDNIIIVVMKNFPAGRICRYSLPALVFFFFHLVLWGQNPALLSGIVTNGNNANAIIGAKITVNNQTTYSVIVGNYSIAVTPVGTFTVTCTKTGFDDYMSSPITFQQGDPVVLNIQLLETANPPFSVSAFLDTLYVP